MKPNEKLRSEAVAKIFKALGHPSRLFIVENLRDAEHCVCELSQMVGADMSTISRHLSILRQAGIVKDRKEGTTVYYSLACSCLSQMVTGAENIIRREIEANTALHFVSEYDKRS
jgi:DNA-binding transcriptional ArsR family regulator